MESEQKHFIKANNSSTSAKTNVLKQGNTFGIFDFSGDIHQIGSDNQGLYHEGTRFLSEFEFILVKERPLFLSSDTTYDNEMLIVDLNNPEFLDTQGEKIGKGKLHILRNKFLNAGVAYEKFTFTNYALQALDIDFQMKCNSDFADIFEVRGEKRKKRGKEKRPSCDKHEILLAYEGLDKIERRTRIRFKPVPQVLFENEMRHNIKLEPGESFEMFVSIACEIGKNSPKILPYESAWKDRLQYNEDIKESIAHIKTSNENFNTWLNRSRFDIVTMVTETKWGPFPYAGIPWFNAPFGRDAIITSMECLWIEPKIAKGTLKYLAAHQATQEDAYKDAEPGKILHEKRRGEMANLHEVPFQQYYGSVDATPLFICLAGKYLERTNDLATIKKIWPSIEKAVKWMEEYGDSDGDGFVEYKKKSADGLTNQGWKDSGDAIFFEDGTIAEGRIALCEVQGYAYMAKLEAARIASALDMKERAASLREEAQELKKKFNQTFWSNAKNTYVLALDNDKLKCDVVTSNAGQCLFTGIAERSKAKKVADTLLDDSMFSGWGIKTLSSKEKRYNPMSYHNGSVWPHDNALIAWGFSKYGLKEEVAKVVRGMFRTSVYVKYRRMPELFSGFDRRKGFGPTAYPVACSPQAWAVGSVFLMIQALLGLSIDAKKRTIYFDQPYLPKYFDSLTVKNLIVDPSNTVSFKVFKRADTVEVELLSQNANVKISIDGKTKEAVSSAETKS